MGVIIARTLPVFKLPTALKLIFGRKGEAREEVTEFELELSSIRFQRNSHQQAELEASNVTPRGIFQDFVGMEPKLVVNAGAGLSWTRGLIIFSSLAKA